MSVDKTICQECGREFIIRNFCNDCMKDEKEKWIQKGRELQKKEDLYPVPNEVIAKTRETIRKQARAEVLQEVEKHKTYLGDLQGNRRMVQFTFTIDEWEKLKEMSK